MSKIEKVKIKSSITIKKEKRKGRKEKRERKEGKRRKKDIHIKQEEKGWPVFYPSTS